MQPQTQNCSGVKGLRDLGSGLRVFTGCGIEEQGVTCRALRKVPGQPYYYIGTFILRTDLKRVWVYDKYTGTMATSGHLTNYAGLSVMSVR